MRTMQVHQYHFAEGREGRWSKYSYMDLSPVRSQVETLAAPFQLLRRTVLDNTARNTSRRRRWEEICLLSLVSAGLSGS